ncbi:acyltransferase [Pullulanibacillus sp. KACC 23026]|uniref:acyltransferase family protein n=1 Tax=Pullulanibacillus sp. KACC 23026 TaxID=3028315 RepID=UPI0023B1EFF7|nr:acyltransferase [Pullulanibacillus sp. KACC 23026]WEG11494.1 acyltransferase [Pullulanibacillus sp. KACC 23026]
MEKNYMIDYFKFFGILLVVWFHAAPFIPQTTGGLNSLYFQYAIPVLPRFDVSYFFVISGYLYGRKLRISTSGYKYTKKYVIRLIKFFVVWYLFYFAYDVLMCIYLSSIHGQSIAVQVKSFIWSQLKLIPIYYGYGKTSYQLWYLTALVWSVLILSAFIKFKKVYFLLGLGLLFNLIGLFGQRYSGIYYLPVPTNDCLFYGLFYTTLGYLIAVNYEWIMEKLNHVKNISLIYLLILFFLLGLAENIIMLGPMNGYKGESNYQLCTIPLTIIIVCFVLKNSNRGKSSIFTRIGGQTVGIYVTHVLFLSIMTNFLTQLNSDYLQSRIWFHILITPVIFVLSYYFYIFLHYFKEFIKKIGRRLSVLNPKSLNFKGSKQT